MAAVWEMEKFYFFLYCRKFILQTDQKLVFSIFRNHMIDVSPMVHRIMIQALQYDFESKYIFGKQNVISEALSQVTPLESQDSQEVLVVNILQYSNIEEGERDELLQESDKDPELQALKKVISTGLLNIFTFAGISEMSL